MKKGILAIFVLMLSISFILAVPDCPLNVLKTYYGTVFYQNNLLSGNYNITAKIGNNFAGSGSVTNGNYGVDISPCSGINGNVDFYINDVKAKESGSYNGQSDWGVEENLNLVIDSKPASATICGDGTKTNNEVCDTNDFGGLTCSNYGFNSGSLRCLSTCDFIYTDNCYNSNNNGNSGGSGGGGGGGGGGGSSGNHPLKVITTPTTNIQTTGEENKTINLSSDKNQEITNPKITSGVIGFIKSSGGLIALSFFVLVVAIGIGVIVLKRKSSKNV